MITAYSNTKLTRLLKWLIFPALAITVQAAAQKPPAKTVYNPAYYNVYDTLITTRLFVNQKYVSRTLLPMAGNSDFTYRANTTNKIGIGINYGLISLNIDYGLGVMNKVKNYSGESQILDLQIHTSTRKLSFDIYGQKYTGLYGYPGHPGRSADNTWYQRPDLKVKMAGLSAYYIFNWRRFSMRAPFLQSEWQKKSAGSFLLGGDWYVGSMSTDSAMLPRAYNFNYNNRPVNELAYMKFGAGLGYAYSFVIKQHWFLTAAATSCFSLNRARETSKGENSVNFDFQPALLVKAAAGYNSMRLTIGLNWFNQLQYYRGKSDNYEVISGQIRLVGAYRFEAGPAFRKKFRFLERR